MRDWGLPQVPKGLCYIDFAGKNKNKSKKIKLINKMALSLPPAIPSLIKTIKCIKKKIYFYFSTKNDLPNMNYFNSI